MKQRSMDVSCKNDAEFDQWVFALLFFAKECKRGEGELAYVSRVWDEKSKERHGIDEVDRMLHKLNVSVKSSFIAQQFAAVDVDKDGKINYSEFVEICNNLKSRPECDELFRKYASAQDHIVAADLLRFYKGEQKVEDSERREGARFLIQLPITSGIRYDSSSL
jgi:Ca2+-binding EF-hand superfamily protein